MDNDPSGQIRSHLAQQAREMMATVATMQSAVVAGSKVDVGIAITAKRFAAAESHIEGVGTLLRRMEASAKQLDEEVAGFVTSVTLLEDVASQLSKVNDECKVLYDTLGNNNTAPTSV